MTIDVEMSISMEMVVNMVIKMQHMKLLLLDMEREKVQSSGSSDKHGGLTLDTKVCRNLR